MHADLHACQILQFRQAAQRSNLTRKAARLVRNVANALQLKLAIRSVGRGQTAKWPPSQRDWSR